MELENKKVRQQNRDITLIFMPLVAILAKMIQFYVLPDKYFFDSWRMLSMMYDGTMAAWAGYQDTVDFYESINFFGLTSITQWSIFMGVIMMPFMMFIVSRTKEMTLGESLYTMMATGILNIYVFGITKEGIQILFFFLIYIVISLPIKNTLIKLVGCAAVYYWESNIFRSYYIIMAALTVFMYFIFIWLRSREKIRRKHIILFVMACFIAVFLFLFLSQYISYDDYIQALNARDGTTATAEGANSSIINPIEVNSNLGNFMVDYVINAFRMMVPIELLVKSPVYAPFVVYQVFVMYYFFRTVKKLKKLDLKMIVTISCFSAYFLGSVIFEPDFGSWVRHEAATFPILQLLAFQSNIHEQEKETKEFEGNKVIIYEG